MSNCGRSSRIGKQQQSFLIYFSASIVYIIFLLPYFSFRSILLGGEPNNITMNRNNHSVNVARDVLYVSCVYICIKVFMYIATDGIIMQRVIIGDNIYQQQPQQKKKKRRKKHRSRTKECKEKASNHKKIKYYKAEQRVFVLFLCVFVFFFLLKHIVCVQGRLGQVGRLIGKCAVVFFSFVEYCYIYIYISISVSVNICPGTSFIWFSRQIYRYI